MKLHKDEPNGADGASTSPEACTLPRLRAWTPHHNGHRSSNSHDDRGRPKSCHTTWCSTCDRHTYRTNHPHGTTTHFSQPYTRAGHTRQPLVSTFVFLCAASFPPSSKASHLQHDRHLFLTPTNPTWRQKTCPTVGAFCDFTLSANVDGTVPNLPAPRVLRHQRGFRAFDYPTRLPVFNHFQHGSHLCVPYGPDQRRREQGHFFCHSSLREKIEQIVTGPSRHVSTPENATATQGGRVGHLPFTVGSQGDGG